MFDFNYLLGKEDLRLILQKKSVTIFEMWYHALFYLFLCFSLLLILWSIGDIDLSLKTQNRMKQKATTLHSMTATTLWNNWITVQFCIKNFTKVKVSMYLMQSNTIKLTIKILKSLDIVLFLYSNKNWIKY
jgi:hypothetical protein